MFIINCDKGEIYFMKKIVIFDLDGTILNTIDDLTDSTNYALEKNGFAKRNVEEIRSFVGNGIKKLIERAVPVGTNQTDTEKVFTDFADYYKVHCADKTAPYEGIQSALVWLKERGYKLAVVSNKADFAVQDLCRQFFDGTFDYVVGEREGIRRKPYPDSVFEVMRFFQNSYLIQEEDRAIYIGDSEVDIKTAENAGIASVLVDWGFRDRDFLVSNGANTVVSNTDDMLEKIEKLMSK